MVSMFSDLVNLPMNVLGAVFGNQAQVEGAPQAQKNMGPSWGDIREDPNKLAALLGVGAQAVDPYGVGGQLGQQAIDYSRENIKNQLAANFLNLMGGTNVGGVPQQQSVAQPQVSQFPVGTPNQKGQQAQFPGQAPTPMSSTSVNPLQQYNPNQMGTPNQVSAITAPSVGVGGQPQNPFSQRPSGRDLPNLTSQFGGLSPAEQMAFYNFASQREDQPLKNAYMRHLMAPKEGSVPTRWSEKTIDGDDVKVLVNRVTGEPILSPEGNLQTEPFESTKEMRAYEDEQLLKRGKQKSQGKEKTAMEQVKEHQEAIDYVKGLLLQSIDSSHLHIGGYYDDSSDPLKSLREPGQQDVFATVRDHFDKELLSNYTDGEKYKTITEYKEAVKEAINKELSKLKQTGQPLVPNTSQSPEIWSPYIDRIINSRRRLPYESGFGKGNTGTQKQIPQGLHSRDADGTFQYIRK